MIKNIKIQALSIKNACTMQNGANRLIQDNSTMKNTTEIPFLMCDVCGAVEAFAIAFLKTVSASLTVNLTCTNESRIIHQEKRIIENSTFSSACKFPAKIS